MYFFLMKSKKELNINSQVANKNDAKYEIRKKNTVAERKKK